MSLYCHRKKRVCDNMRCDDCDYYNGSGVGQTQTNADRIRAMSDEDLAWELMTWRVETLAKSKGDESHYPNTKATILEWLRQPAEDWS